MLKYIVIYIISGIFGWLIEYIYSQRTLSTCADTLNRKYLHICLPFLHLWAVGGTFLLFMRNCCLSKNKIILAIIAGLLMTIIECVAGKISHKVNGKKTWNYENNVMPMCDCYVALDITIYWCLFAFIFFIIFD